MFLEHTALHYQDETKQIVKRGHEVGSHGMYHQPKEVGLLDVDVKQLLQHDSDFLPASRLRSRPATYLQTLSKSWVVQRAARAIRDALWSSANP